VSPRGRKLGVILGLLALALVYGWTETGGDAARGSLDTTAERLYEARRSGVVLEGHGIVEKVLADDRDGSRHQRLILRLPSGHTLLVSHNIDLAPRVADVERGDELGFRGQYEWNDRGGVVHWTHHDPQGRRPGGWLRHRGRTYR
jgi:hypothetical protein